MTPVECIARLCALVPPPRYPLTRFHGVLAPRAKLRPRIVPRPPDSVAHACERSSPRGARERGANRDGGAATTSRQERPHHPGGAAGFGDGARTQRRRGGDPDAEPLVR